MTNEELVELAARAFHDGPLEAEEYRFDDPENVKSADWCREVAKTIINVVRPHIEAEATERTIDFVLGHHEAGPMPFTPDPVDPDEWWSKIQLPPLDPARLHPKSRAHFEARKARWKEPAIAAAIREAGK